MQLGTNVDPLNDLARPDPVTLRSMGFAWARLVVRPDCEAYVRACYAAGLNVLGVLTPESLPFRAGAEQYRDWPLACWQIGNEMDSGGLASSTMDPGTWRNFYYACLSGLGWPSVPILAGSFASGQPDLAASYLVVDGITGYGVHPYAKDADAARVLLREYRARFPALDVWVTEWNRPAAEIAAFTRMLEEEQIPVACWFAWSDAQSLWTEGIRLGLADEHGNPKPELAALLQVLEEDNTMALPDVSQPMRDFMARHQDSPIDNSRFSHNSQAELVAERCHGHKAEYVKTSASGDWEEVVIPFPKP